MQKITDNVYIETGFRGCNTGFVVTGEGVVVIDTPMIPADAKKWRIEANKFGPVKYVINTEPHTDHTSGNCYFGGIVVSHEGSRDALLARTKEEVENTLRQLAPDSLPLEDGFRFRPPSITYSQKMTLYLGEHTFRLVNLPGHTPFQSVVFIPEEGLAFTSDNICLRGPVFPVNTRPFEWLDSLKRIQALGANILVPGHGDICAPADIPKMSAQVQDWIDAVSYTISKGMTLEEALEKFSLPGKRPADSVMATPFAGQMQRRSVTHLYGVLKSEKKTLNQ
jgi:glyoxylase-like metal-dependent hydrolase (beta-lactamase superfamily II)